MVRGIIVTDLGFGDAGKGSVTDLLCRKLGARLVVRHNGGAQAGHNVVVQGGRHHTFSQFGAGTFCPGVRTFLSRFMVVHPGGLLHEAQRLRGKGVPDALQRLTIDPRARLITPFHQAANRLREVLRGADRHGSCGLGVGETMHHSLEHPREGVLAQDLHSPGQLRRKLCQVQQRYWQEFSFHRTFFVKDPVAAPEMALLESGTVLERFVDQACLLAPLVEESTPPRGTVIFEGAQGVLLDEWRGFHPHTTWSTCTFDNALEILREWNGEAFRLGVTRTYQTRHGAGPFPTEEANLEFPEPHNAWGPWQRGFRQGWLDLVLLRYAVEVCGGLDGLAVTHLDAFRSGWKVAESYQDLRRLPPGPFQDLDYQEALTQQLQGARPTYTEIATEKELLERLSTVTQAAVLLRSYGALPHHKLLTPAWENAWRSPLRPCA